jgi:hypothetical protein
LLRHSHVLTMYTTPVHVLHTSITALRRCSIGDRAVHQGFCESGYQ